MEITRLVEAFINEEWVSIPFGAIKKGMIVSLWETDGSQILNKNSVIYPNYLVTKDAYQTKDKFWVFEYETKDN